MKQLRLTATTLRIVLSVTILLIVIAGYFVWQFGHGSITKLAKEVAATNQQATNSGNDLNNLQSIKSQLQNRQETVKKAASLVAESQGYQYQNQITEDLQSFASNAGVTIQSYNFSSSTTPGVTTSSAPTSGKPIAGLKTVTETIALKSPLSYTSYLQFINDIQNNSLRMQISGLSLSVNSDGLSSAALTITAFTK